MRKQQENQRENDTEIERMTKKQQEHCTNINTEIEASENLQSVTQTKQPNWKKQPKQQEHHINNNQDIMSITQTTTARLKQ